MGRNYRLVFAWLGMAGMMLMLAGCGGSSPASMSSSSTTSSSSNLNSTTASLGSVTLFGADAPVCDVISFVVTITGATLTPQGGGTPVSLLSQGKSIPPVDFAQLMDFSTVLNFASVQTGTYSAITLTLSAPQLTVLDATANPPAPTTIPTTFSTTSTTATVTVSISPPLNVTSNGSAGLEVEFNLLKSVLVDRNGQVTGTVNPVFQVSPTRTSTEDGMDKIGEVEDLEGIVQSVTTSSSNSSFTGSFVVETANGSNFPVNTKSSTEFEDDAPGLSSLMAGDFVEVDAFVDSNGNIVAKEVEVEQPEETNPHEPAFTGLVTSVKRDTSGRASAFDLVVLKEQPDQSATIPLDSTLVVNVLPSTKFRTAAKGTDEDELRFGPANLGAGQRVVVLAQPQSGMTTSAVNADAVLLKLQSVLGTFSALLDTEGDDLKLGAFLLLPCSALFNGQTILVVTHDDTAFADVNDLAALTPQPNIIVKGLLFFEPTPVSVVKPSIQVKVPTWVLEAKQVHQL